MCGASFGWLRRMKAGYLLASIAALGLLHSTAIASEECMATIDGPTAVTLVGFLPAGDGKEITTTVKPGERFIAAPPYDAGEKAWRVYLKSGIEGRIDRDRLRLLPDEPLMKLNFSASKRQWRKAKTREGYKDIFSTVGIDGFDPIWNPKPYIKQNFPKTHKILFGGEQ